MKQVTLLIVLFLFTSSAKAQIDDSTVLELIETQRYPELASYLESVYPNGTEDPKILNRLAYAYYMGGNLVKAESNYQKLLAQDTTKISSLNSLANVASKRGNYPEVIKYYKRILDLDSSNFYIVKQTAYAYQQLDDVEHTFEYLKKASTLNPQDADIAYDYSKNLVLEKKLPEADSVLQKALKADPLNLLLLRGLLSVNNASSNFKDVLKTGEKLFALGDSTNETKNKVAQAYYYTNRPEKCIELMNQLIIDDVPNETTFYFLGLSHRKLAQTEKSNSNFNLAIEAGLSNNLGIYYQELGRNREQQIIF